MIEVRRAVVADAAVLARLLWDFNTEFETEVDDVDVLEVRFARLVELDDIVAVLAEEGGAAVGFALVSLRPAFSLRASSYATESSEIEAGLGGVPTEVRQLWL